MARDLIVRRYDSILHSHQRDPSAQPSDGTTVDESSIMAEASSYSPQKLDSALECEHVHIDAISLGHQAFNDSCNDSHVNAVRVDRPTTIGVAAALIPYSASLPLWIRRHTSRRAMSRPASDAAVRDMTIHVTTSTPPSWENARSTAWSEPHQPGVVFAQEMASPVELCHHSFDLAVSVR
ncbi:hypothetical protein [Kibdelosporangium philippinense]|uniref:hypothetical protein n=1 Tax=Kibdelosporangium philippinense TaxID=211113 RepID=UPI003608FE1A